jgi:hypothetical protein
MRQLGHPTLLCHRLDVAPDGRLTGYRIRLPDHKRKTVAALRELNFRTIAAGDSYNDTAMLSTADAGILFRPPENVIRDFPQFPVVSNYAELRLALLLQRDSAVDRRAKFTSRGRAGIDHQAQRAETRRISCAMRRLRGRVRHAPAAWAGIGGRRLGDRACGHSAAPFVHKAAAERFTQSVSRQIKALEDDLGVAGRRHHRSTSPKTGAGCARPFTSRSTRCAVPSARSTHRIGARCSR